MSLSTERHCPRCSAETTFWRVAATGLHLGEKTKWHCGECDFGVVRINDVVDTGASA